MTSVVIVLSRKTWQLLTSTCRWTQTPKSIVRRNWNGKPISLNSESFILTHVIKIIHDLLSKCNCRWRTGFEQRPRNMLTAKLTERKMWTTLFFCFYHHLVIVMHLCSGNNHCRNLSSNTIIVLRICLFSLFRFPIYKLRLLSVNCKNCFRFVLLSCFPVNISTFVTFVT